MKQAQRFAQRFAFEKNVEKHVPPIEGLIDGRTDSVLRVLISEYSVRFV